MQNLLIAIATLFFSSFVMIADATALTGSVIYNQIIEKLNSYNLDANPSIDHARRFPSCENQLLIKSIFGSWKTVQISCPDTDWKIAVRTNIKGGQNIENVENQRNNSTPKFIIALSTSLNKGDIIDDTHLVYVKTEKKIGGGVFYKKDHLIGRNLKRSLSVGTIIKTRHLNPNWIIEKNQLVTIEHKVGSIVINAKGIAQEPGQLGQKIWVNNFNSGKKVLCWIKNDKKVTTNAKVY